MGVMPVTFCNKRRLLCMNWDHLGFVRDLALTHSFLGLLESCRPRASDKWLDIKTDCYVRRREKPTDISHGHHLMPHPRFFVEGKKYDCWYIFANMCLCTSVIVTSVVYCQFVGPKKNVEQCYPFHCPLHCKRFSDT